LVPSFSSPWKKTKQKKTPVSRLILRVAAADGARGNSPACGKPSAGSDKSARFFPSAPSMLGAGQRDIQNQNLKSHFQPSFEELFFGVK
jgi:hypothetical protein